MAFYSSELINGGVLIGQAIMLEDTQPSDVTIYGKRYLRSGNVETNTANFNTNVFTSKKAISEVSQTSGFGASNINDIFYSQSVGVAIAVGVAGKLFTSVNFTSWGAETSGFGASNINAVTRANSLFVAVGDGGKISTSIDSSTWTARTSGVANNLNDVAWIDGLSKFIAFGLNGDNTSSADGITWAVGTNIVSHYNCIAATGSLTFSKVLAGAANGTLVRSTDGSTWLAVDGKFSGSSINAIAFSGALIVVVGNDGKISTSTDGVNYTARASDVGTDNITDVKYKDGLFVATTATGKFTISADGVVWQSQNNIAAQITNALTIDGNSILFAGNSGELITATWGYYAGSTVEHQENGEYQYIRIS